MRHAWILVLLAFRVAAAQPVSFQLQGDVPIGQKPVLRVRAEQKVSDVKVELERDDGKHFTMRQPALAKGQIATFAVGDGAAGKATYTGTLSARVAGGEAWSNDVHFDTFVRAPMKVSYDIDHLDLD